MGKYEPEDIDPTICTHVVYAFVALDPVNFIMKPTDKFVDQTFYQKITALKSRGVKVTIGLGGWLDSTEKYSKMVNNPAARKKFVRHAVNFIEQNNFDGLDLDWEYPRCWQVS